MNAIPSSSLFITRAYTLAFATSPVAVARINAAAFRVSHIINQPVFSATPDMLRRSDTVNISPDAVSLLKAKTDIRPLVTLPVDAEFPTGLMLDITV